MTARPAWPAVSGAATFQDIRRALAGQVVKSAAGVLRTGILPIGTGPLMVGTASMVVNVQTCVVALDRNGAVFLPNDGVQPVQLSSAPSSGSRWSIVYAKQRETEAPFSDTVAGPLIDKVESTTSESAARNLLPAGARELGVWKIDAGVTTTNAATGVTYTETVPYTAMEGGGVLLRNQTEQDAWAPHDGSLAYRLDTGETWQRAGGSWGRLLRQPTGWTNLTLSDGWTNQGTYPPLRVRFDASGNLHIQGQIIPRSGYPSSEVFATLPTGGRPSIRLEVPVINNNAATRASAGVLIDTNGNMNLTQAGVGAFSFGNTVIAPV